MTAQKKVRVPSPDLQDTETLQVVSEDSGTVGAILTRTELSRRQVLEKAISAYMDAFRRESSRYVPQPGDYVLAHSELSEPRWCRALVLDVSFSLVRVDQVDYGHTEEVRSCDIVELPEILSTQPAYSVRLQVDATQFRVAETYNVRLGNYVNDLQRTIEAFPAVEHPPGKGSAEDESGPLVIPEDVGTEETGVVRGFMTTSENSTLYGVQHREGFEVMADQLAQSELRSKSVVHKGDFVIVPYDSFLCRALVTEIGAESARVYHVDFGSWDTVSLSNLFCLPAGSTTETPQLSFQCVTEDGAVLTENQQYKFELKSTLKDHGYPVHVCKASLPGSDLPSVCKVTDLPTNNVQAVKTVRLVEKHCLNGRFYGAVVPEGNTPLSAIEQQLDECLGDPSAEFLNEPHVGDLVISFIDGKFYRSVVCEISDAGICLFQIDVGNFSSCSSTVIMTLPEKLLAYPSVALLCLLDDDQNASELMSTFRVRNFRKHSTVYDIDVFTFETGADESGMTLHPAHFEAAIEEVPNYLCADLGYVTAEDTQANDAIEYHTDQGYGDGQSYYIDQECITSEGSGARIHDLSHSTFTAARSRASTPTQKILEPRRLQHYTFPESTPDDMKSSFLDVKIISVSPADDKLITLSVALIDRQELIEEALSLIEPDSLKPLYLSDLRDESPGVMKSGDSWVRVVAVERPGPNSCVVQLVDYGVRMSCKVSELFCCPSEYIPIEICTLSCQVARTSPDSATNEAFVGQIVVLKHSDANLCTIYSRETGEVITL